DGAGLAWVRVCQQAAVACRRRPGLQPLEQRCTARLAALLRDAFEGQEELEAFLEHRTSLWNLLTYATARDDRIELVCAWIDVLFAIDDVFAQAPPSRIRQLGIHQLAAVIDGRGPAVDTAFTHAFGQLRDQTRPLMPQGVWRRYVRTLHEFLQACHAERDLVRDLAAVDLPTYEKCRNSSIGGCCFPLLEFGLGIDLSDRLEELPQLRRLNMLVARHWIGVNDVFSYRKELYSGDTMNEIQLALAENGGDLQAAVDRIAATVHRVETEIDHHTTTLRTGLEGQNGGLIAYLDALEAMIAGNLEWSYLTPRYNGRGHTWNGLTDATVILTPDRTLYLPHGHAPSRARATR
ncbi:terpene synthase family protein, partial [Streptomyces albidochromogenes]|uniref:terpene synthase family protein n=1 Tax=Streptomyces albidochromogenes TaxID=329524 RepID=UPI001ABF6B62